MGSLQDLLIRAEAERPEHLTAELVHYLRKGVPEVAELVADWLDPNGRRSWQLVFRLRHGHHEKGDELAHRNALISNTIARWRHFHPKPKWGEKAAFENKLAKYWRVSAGTIHAIWMKQKK
jgi:hypothetical protein